VAKAGVLHFTKLAAAELSPQGIRVNAVLPGYVATPIIGQVFGLDADASRRVAQAVADDGGRTNPLGRAGAPRDIADAVVFLASDESAYVTGAHLVVDGGITIGPRHAWDRATRGPLADTLSAARAALRTERGEG